MATPILCPACHCPLDFGELFKRFPVADILKNLAVCHCGRVLSFDDKLNVRLFSPEEEIALGDELRIVLDRAQEAAVDVRKECG